MYVRLEGHYKYTSRDLISTHKKSTYAIFVRKILAKMAKHQKCEYSNKARKEREKKQRTNTIYYSIWQLFYQELSLFAHWIAVRRSSAYCTALMTLATQSLCVTQSFFQPTSTKHRLQNASAKGDNKL